MSLFHNEKKVLYSFFGLKHYLQNGIGKTLPIHSILINELKDEVLAITNIHNNNIFYMSLKFMILHDQRIQRFCFIFFPLLFKTKTESNEN